jgi:hypothetical protein
VDHDGAQLAVPEDQILDQAVISIVRERDIVVHQLARPEAALRSVLMVLREDAVALDVVCRDRDHDAVGVRREVASCQGTR